jgi:hypothetical protein
MWNKKVFTVTFAIALALWVIVRLILWKVEAEKDSAITVFSNL